MKHFKVKIGYGKDEFVIIDETEFEKAVIASGTGKMAVFKDGVVSGNHIISILPFYNIEMGWTLDYQPHEEDYILIGNKKRDEYNLFIQEKTQISNNKLLKSQ